MKLSSLFSLIKGTGSIKLCREAMERKGSETNASGSLLFSFLFSRMCMWYMCTYICTSTCLWVHICAYECVALSLTSGVFLNSCLSCSCLEVVSLIKLRDPGYSESVTLWLQGSCLCLLRLEL